jgi:hypothetical protein
MAADKGQTWYRLAAADDSMPGSFRITTIFIDAPTQTITLKAPFSTTTKSLISVTSWVGAVPMCGTAVEGSIVATTLGSGAEVYVYHS